MSQTEFNPHRPTMAAMLEAKREMAAERIKKETDGAVGVVHSLDPQLYVVHFGPSVH